VAVDSGLQLVIEDNGRGFDRTTIEPGRNGLSNMQRRLEAIGGTFELTAQPGCGTRIRLRLELPNLARTTPHHPD
jgi:signal transduction histidine kinase